MDISPANIYSKGSSSNRSRSRTRNSTANSRSTSSSRRPSLGRRRSLSSSSASRINIVPTKTDTYDNAAPAVESTLDTTLPLDFFRQDILALVKALRVSKWHKKQLNPNYIVVNRISGALTNSIYKIEYKDEDNDKVKIPALLLRVYGKNVDDIIDRDLELQVLTKLSQKGIGPKLLGIFTNGRFEQFLEGFITLTKEQIRDEIISQMIGRRMKDLHYKIQLDEKDICDNLPMCWKLIDKWANIFETEIQPTFNGHTKEEDAFLMQYHQFKQLVNKYRQWLFGHYPTQDFNKNFKFCHNDTQYGNLLLLESFNYDDIIISRPPSNASLNSISTVKTTSNKKDNNLVVIDFEYSGSNFPAFDLANHFSEWMANYHDPLKSYYLNENNFPSQLQQLNLIKAYVEYDFQYPSSTLNTPSMNLENTNASELVQYEIKKLFNECILWRASVQIYWCFWGLIQNGPIKQENPLDSLASTSENKGVDSTYKITTGVTALDLDESAVIEEDLVSSDDSFDYLKFSQQKAGLAIGDLIKFGFLSSNDINKDYTHMIKSIDFDFFPL